MFKPGEYVHLHPRDSHLWERIRGTVVSDDGFAIRVTYPNGTIAVVPWDTVARATVDPKRGAA